MDIQKKINSKKDNFAGGNHGLQARRAQAIECHLQLYLKNKRSFINASEHAAEASGLAAKYGGRQLRTWTRRWIAVQKLPESLRGRHGKVFCLLDDPVVAAELRAYLRSMKWAMDPLKLAEYTQDKLIHAEAEKYVQKVTCQEMPESLKNYVDLELLPCIHLKIRRGISLSTARRWMRKEGFTFTSHKKGLYFDGHDHPDVVEYRQNIFIKAIDGVKKRLIRFSYQNIDSVMPQSNFVEWKLVLCAHDEMTAQANDSRAKYWVFKDQHALRKKGAGRCRTLNGSIEGSGVYG